MDGEPFKVSYASRKWRSRSIDFKIHRVCATCNNGWMSVLENETAPILRRMMMGNEFAVALSSPDQFTLACWAYKMALILEFFVVLREDEKKHPRIPPQAYHDFYKDQTPPLNRAAIWTAAYGGVSQHGPVHAGHAARHTLPFEGVLESDEAMPRSKKWFAYSTTFTVYRSVFQVLGHLRGDFAPSKTGEEKSPLLIRLWPMTGEAVVWPRNGSSLSNTGLEEFARRTDFE